MPAPLNKLDGDSSKHQVSGAVDFRESDEVWLAV